MAAEDLETDIAVLKQQVFDLAAQIAALGAPAGGFLAAAAPGQIIAEPKPVTAFDVRKVDGVWKMYFPSGCLMCDGVAASGINPGPDGYVAVPQGNVGIGITWIKDKDTKLVGNVVATINQIMASTLTVTEGASAYTIAANFPVATMANNEIRQITSGFVSLSSDTGDAGKGVGVDDVSIEEYENDSDSDAEPVHAIKGWHESNPSTSKLADLLTGSTEDTSRQLLVRNGKGGSIEFIPLGRISKLSGTVSFVGDNRYDVSTHQLQHRIDTLNLATGAITQGTWTMITGGQAVPHSEL